MGQDFTETEPPVDIVTIGRYSESHTELFRAELLLSFFIKDRQQSYQLLIEAPTLKEGIGIYRGASAQFLATVLQGNSNGD